MKKSYEIGLIVLILIFGVAYQSAQSYIVTSNWAINGRNILTGVLRLDDILADLERAHREALRTGKTSAESAANLVRVRRQLELETNLLLPLVAQSSEQKSDLESITKSFTKVFAALSGGQPEDDVYQAFDELKINLHKLEQTESRQFLTRPSTARQTAIQTFLVTGIGLLFAILFLVLARIVMLRDLKKIRLGQEELKKAREEAEMASQYKSRFLANVSHEIRTPMNAVLGMANMLLRTNPRADQKEYCDTIRHSGHALLRILQDTLDLSRIEAGKLELDIAPFDPRKFLVTVCDILRPSVLESVRLITEVDEKIPLVLLGDSGRIQQILINFGSNSTKFTDSGHILIRISSSEAGNEVPLKAGQSLLVRFEVIDTGLGIPQSSLNRLFLPFSQVSPKNPREKMGTGLGLSICKRFIEAMHGQVGVESEVGRGSRFFFDLPLAVAEPSQATASERHEYDAGAETLRFSGSALIIDDNPGNLKVAELTLRSIGFEVTTTLDPEDGVRLARSHYDIIFMDCEMPVMDGYTAAEQIRAFEKGKRRTPIVALTAHTAPEVHEKCLSFEMDDFLVKPLDFEHLLAVVGRFLTPLPLTNPEPAAVAKTSLASSAKGSGAIDYEILQSLQRLNPPRGEFDSSSDVIDELIRLFSSSIERSLAKLNQFISEKDFAKLGAEAHYLKSSSTSVGALKVTSILEKFEALKTIPPGGHLPVGFDLNEGYIQLGNECTEATKELRRWAKQASSL